jgi:norsolorinic acid ketoreductase
VGLYLSRPDNTVVAAVRNPSSREARALGELPKAPGNTLVVVKIDSTSDTDAQEAVTDLTAAHGITKLDVVIANAGIFRVHAYTKVSDMKPADLLEHVDVNTAGTLRLFQATLPLLQKGTNPRFLGLSAVVSSISGMEDCVPFTMPASGASKAALNFLVRRIHFEHPELITFAVHPGLVQTDNGNAASQFFGLPEALVTVEDSVNGIVSLLDSATREKTSGNFLSYDGSNLIW